jgi:tRNA(Leu) C34 or U34 (ribose-2'-O)-methylase TrmL
MSRGYFGIGIINGKFDANEGQLLRSGHCFGADFIFTVGKRYSKQPTDTTCADRHVPLYEYKDIDDLLTHRPYGCTPVCIELKPYSKKIENFIHPERAIYILGPEDSSLPDSLCMLFPTIQIPTQICLNVCVAGSIVMYDRILKSL